MREFEDQTVHKTYCAQDLRTTLMARATCAQDVRAKHAHATAGAWRRKGLYREHATSQRGRRWARLARASTRILRKPVPARAA